MPEFSEETPRSPKSQLVRVCDPEVERIRAVYARRRQKISPARYALIQPFNLLSLQERELAIASFLRASGIPSLAGRKILDIGCGQGQMLRRLLEFKADPKKMFGLDLVPEYLDAARRLSPHFCYIEGNAAELPFSDGSFDVVHQSTLFSSILDVPMKRAIAREMLRVLRLDGFILWYDFFVNNPRNPNVRGVDKREIHQLFPMCQIRLRRLTVAPPIGRIVGRYSPALYILLSSIKIACTHYLCFIARP